MKDRVMIGAALSIAALFGAYRMGAAGVQEEWDLAEKTRKITEDAAVIQRYKENALKAVRYEDEKIELRGKYEEEIASLRSQYAGSGRLRVSTRFCGGAATATATEGTTGGDEAPAGTRVLSEEADRDIKSVIFEMDSIVEQCRMAQQFLDKNDLVER